MTEDVMGVPVAWMTTRADDTTFPRLHRAQWEADQWIRECTVNPPICKQPLYTAAQARALADAEVAREREAVTDVFDAYKSWPADIRKKLSVHDLRRMNGWRPVGSGEAAEAWLFEEHGYAGGEGGRELRWERNADAVNWTQTPLYRRAESSTLQQVLLTTILAIANTTPDTETIEDQFGEVRAMAATALSLANAAIGQGGGNERS